MSNLQKLFLVMVISYLIIKISLGLLMLIVSKRLENKGLEVQRKKKAAKEETIEHRSV